VQGKPPSYSANLLIRYLPTVNLMCQVAGFTILAGTQMFVLYSGNLRQ